MPAPTLKSEGGAGRNDGHSRPAERVLSTAARPPENRGDERSGFGPGMMGLGQFLRDASYGFRTLRKNAAFTSAAVLTLALGLGLNTALFTWFNAVAFRPLPVQSPRQLFAIERLDAQGRATKSMSYPDFLVYRDRVSVFSGLIASARFNATPWADVELMPTNWKRPEPIGIQTVSTNYFTVLGAQMVLGRSLIAEDESSSAANSVIVLSYRFWQNYFGGDPTVIGKNLRLNGLASDRLAIVGVAGPDFVGTTPNVPAGWVPLLMRNGQAWRTDRNLVDYTMIGRLRPGISQTAAENELQSIARHIAAQTTSSTRAVEQVGLTSSATYLNLSSQSIALLLPLLCAFGAVLLISCANVSNLVLARAVTRQFEFAVRRALGATGGRLFKQVLTESLILGMLGGVAGWLVATVVLRAVLPRLFDMIPGASAGLAGLDLRADHRVFAFTFLVSTLAGALGGLIPAFQAANANVVSALKNEGSAFGRQLRPSRIRNLLAVAQITLGSALLFTAGMLVQSALRVQFVELGFDKSRLAILEPLAPRDYDPPQLKAARQRVLKQIEALPGVVGVCEMPRMLFAVPSKTTVGVPIGETANVRTTEVTYSAVPTDYFSTLQLPVIRGRAFATNESASDLVAVISDTAARQFFPVGNALGQKFDLPLRILMGESKDAAARGSDWDDPRATVTVIGVARDTSVNDLRRGDGAVIYLPLPQEKRSWPYILIRTQGPVDPALSIFRRAGIDATGLVPQLYTAEELFADKTVAYRVLAWIAGSLAVLSLVIAVIGLYGVMSFAVNQRVKEIGIRMALGATPASVAKSVVMESLRLVGIGAVLGFGLSVAIAFGIQRVLLDVSAFEPLAFFGVTLLVALVGILACWLPARRAAKCDPMIALRAE